MVKWQQKLAEQHHFPIPALNVKNQNELISCTRSLMKQEISTHSSHHFDSIYPDSSFQMISRFCEESGIHSRTKQKQSSRSWTKCLDDVLGTSPIRTEHCDQISHKYMLIMSDLLPISNQLHLDGIDSRYHLLPQK